MTIQEAIAQVLEDKGQATNHELEAIVPTIVNCNASTVLREARKLDLVVKPTFKEGKQTRTWIYSLPRETTYNLDGQVCFA